MAKKNQGIPEIPTAPNWETRAKRPFTDGRWQGIDNSVWLWRSVPMASVTDARSDEDMVNVGRPLAAAYEEMGALAGRGVNRRQVRGTYRDTHALLVNVPRLYRAPEDHPIRDYLNRGYGDKAILDRFLLFGVKLRDNPVGRGWRAAIESAAETMRYGGAPIEDFDQDAERVGAGLARAGFSVPTMEQMHMADSWWNFGGPPGITVLPHEEHMHYFRTTAAAKRAEAAGLGNCEEWPEQRDEYAISYALVQDLDLRYLKATDDTARWVTKLVDRGARVVSIRAKVEPSSVTRNELRGQVRRYRSDIEEMQQQNKMDRQEMNERFAETHSMEVAYSSGNAAVTLTETSIIAGFDGKVRDISEYSPAGITLASIVNRQAAAWHETMACSSVRANPYPQDLPASTIAFSALPSISRVGDKTGALLGFTERDRQPSYFNSRAASTVESTSPVVNVLGASGSGKLLTLDSRIPTPSGWTTMGDLRAGDEVLGRDGLPCRVVRLSEIDETPDLYRVTLSDGQVIDADANHQWVVSTFGDRNGHRKSGHVAAIENWRTKQKAARDLHELAESVDPDAEYTLTELFEAVTAVAGLTWATPGSLLSVLELLDVPSRLVTGRSKLRVLPPFEKTDPVTLYPAGDALRDIASHKARLARVTSWHEPRIDKRAEIARTLVAAGAPSTSAEAVRGILSLAGTAHRRGTALVRNPGGPARGGGQPMRVYRAAHTIATIANRVAEKYIEPRQSYAERIMTTSEMVAEGLTMHNGGKQYAIRVAGALELRERALPVPAYTLGAWLGDGSAHSAGITSMDREIIAGIENDGYAVTRTDGMDGNQASTYFFAGLRTELAKLMERDLDAPSNKLVKRIPMEYLRASREQRLALLQGLMDTDGTISENGNCELTLVNRDLIGDALELIRSLGIKAQLTEGTAAMILPTGERVETGIRYRVHFTTAEKVFRLPRKAERLPEAVRETQNWLYIESIEKIESRPGRCIQVDSPDSTYLAEGFVPTHNTIFLQFLADQLHRMGIPQLIVNPKAGDSLRDSLEPAGARVFTLDALVSSDGILDPLRIFDDPEMAVSKAVSMIATVNPYGPDAAKYLTDIGYAIKQGVAMGAKATGHALLLAVEAGEVAPEVVEPVFRFAQVYPMFGATFGMRSEGEALKLSDGMTLVEVGQMSFELPSQNFTDDISTHPDPTVRTSMNVIRMLIWGGMNALRHRGGAAVHFDESWVMEMSAPGDLDQVGRLARSWDLLPILYTQKPSLQVKIGLKGYFSRGFIGHIKDPDERDAALAIFGQERNTEMRERITQGRHLANDAGLNYRSLQHLHDETGLKRGSVFYHVDLNGRVAPVEVALSKEFLRLASTDPEDVRIRREEQARAQRDRDQIRRAA